jgi:Fe2+ or Zn2+ uptake regulation protein
MSIESMMTVLNAGNLTPRRKLILLGIANHDGDGGSWPSISTLARYAGCSERTVQRELHRLTEEGFVTIELQAGGSARTRADRRPNLYRLSIPHVVDNSDHGVTPTVTPTDSRGDIAVSQRGDIAVSPETSLTVPYTSKRDSYVPESESVDNVKLTREQVRDILTQSAFCPTCREKLSRCLCDQVGSKGRSLASERDVPHESETA